MNASKMRWLTGVVALGLALLPGLASAHEKWFADHTTDPIDSKYIFSLQTLLAIGAAGLAVLLVRLIEPWMKRKFPILGQSLPATFSDDRLQLIYDWIPLIMAIHVAVPLIVNGITLHLFAPNLALPSNILGGFIALAQVVVALGFIYGALTRYVAVVLVVLFFSGFLFFPPLYVLEHFNFVGIAAFFYLLGRGRFSVDNLVGLPGQNRMVNLAVPALRAATGITLIVLALTEKLWNPQQALGFLEQRPDFYFLPALGLGGLGKEFFIYAAGIVEFVFGVLVLNGRLLRFLTFFLWLPFNLTLVYLGWPELVGHLPIYGTMLILLFFGDVQPEWVSLAALNPFRRRQSAASPQVAISKTVEAER